MTVLYPSQIETRRPVRKPRTKNRRWLPDMTALVETLQGRIGECVSPPSMNGTGNHVPDLFDQLHGELSRDMDQNIGKEEVITLLVLNVLSVPLVASFFPDRCKVESLTTLDILTDQLVTELKSELECLTDFYAGVEKKCRTIRESDEHLAFITEIYDDFFRLTFPLLSRQLGIFYTPRAIVDFILHSVDDLLTQHGGRSLGDPDLQILDPFTGTGTFPTRLITGNILPSDTCHETLARRLHAQEIVLLASRIATVQVESAFHGENGNHIPWEGCDVLDTFASTKPPDLLDSLRERRNTPAPDVIIGNPPWSITQRHADDDHQGAHYPWLDDRIRVTYAAENNGVSSVPLFDSCVRAIRWSTDRLADEGIIGFVINSSFIMARTLSGLRRSLVEEFSHIYIVNLRGDIRNNIYSEWQNGEGENIFGGRTMTGSALLFLVRKPKGYEAPGKILYHSLPDNLTTEGKRDQLDSWQSIASLDWQVITPDDNHDWFKPRRQDFADFSPVVTRRSTGDEPAWFSQCRETVRPASESWCINASRKALVTNMTAFIKEYNQEVGSKESRGENNQHHRIKWTDSLRQQAKQGVKVDTGKGRIQTVMLHPFVKRYLYVHPDLPFGRGFMDDLNKTDQEKTNLDSTGQTHSVQRLIVPFNGGPDLGFSALMVDVPPICSSSDYYCLPNSSSPPHTRSGH